MNYWVNYPKFTVSLLKALYGNDATKENNWGYDWWPKIDGNYSWMYIFDDMYRGSSMRVGGKEPGPEGFITFGMNPVGIGPNSSKMINALSKLKWMVVGENYDNPAWQELFVHPKSGPGVLIQFAETQET